MTHYMENQDFSLAKWDMCAVLMALYFCDIDVRHFEIKIYIMCKSNFVVLAYGRFKDINIIFKYSKNYFLRSTFWVVQNVEMELQKLN